MYKIVTYVSLSDADKVRQSMGEAGAGKLGKYTFCSFYTRGIGRFKPGEGAKPHIGSVGDLEEVEEERIEVVCHKDVVGNVIAAIKRAHPYEEVPIDVYPLEIW